MENFVARKSTIMRFNEKDLIALSHKDGEFTGRLSYTQYKGPLGSQRDAGKFLFTSLAFE